MGGTKSLFSSFVILFLLNFSVYPSYGDEVEKGGQEIFSKILRAFFLAQKFEEEKVKAICTQLKKDIMSDGLSPDEVKYLSEVFVVLGITHFIGGNIEGAKAELKKAFSINPELSTELIKYMSPKMKSFLEDVKKEFMREKEELLPVPVSFYSEPKGVRVSLNGNFHCLTPCTVPVKAGYYIVCFEHEGETVCMERNYDFPREEKVIFREKRKLKISHILAISGGILLAGGIITAVILLMPKEESPKRMLIKFVE